MTTQNTPHFAIKGQYIKDLSFENPNAPHSLVASNQKPTIEVEMQVKPARIEEGIFETQLKIVAKAKVEQGALFLVDLTYAGLFEVQNVEAEKIEPLLMVDAAFVLFPFARRVIADASRDGGFPPLMLDPIDFHALYLHNKRQQAAAGA